MSPTAKKTKTSRDFDEETSERETDSVIWCKSCSSWAKTDCPNSKDHSCVAASEARKLAEEQFQKARKEFEEKSQQAKKEFEEKSKKAREEFKLEERRFLAIAAVCDYQSGAVLEGTVDYQDDGDSGWCINGGSFQIELAGSSITEDEKERLVEEIEGTEIDLKTEAEECASFLINMEDRNIISFVEKLPTRTEGVTLPAGTIFLKKSNYWKEYHALVFDKEIKPHVYEHEPIKILGHVDSVEAFCINICDECECGRYCEHGKYGSSTISAVQFCDDD